VSYIATYAAALAVFLIADAIWLTAVMKPVFERNVGDLMLASPRLGPAAVFYALYVAGILYFATWPAASAGSWRVAAANGALLGFLAYGTYEATNLATLRGWTYGMLAIDLTWPAASAGSWRVAAANGALLGFLAYGTYEATNLATLRGWTYGMLAIDLTWGTLLTALSATAGYLAYRWVAG